jgi:hypothetical protein
MNRIALLAGASAAAVLASLAAVGGSAAFAADGPSGIARYERVQAKVDYTVYAPTRAFGLPRTGFQRNGCGGDRDDFITVNYGSQAELTDQSITLQESPGSFGCVDGPDGVGPAGTFRVNGAPAKVMGACAGGKSTCRKSTAELVGQSAYTVVTLPGSASRPTTTYVEVYSQAMSLAEIKAFVRGLVPAT